MTMFYGNCWGGPFDGRPIAHGTPKYLVAVDRHRPMRAAPGILSSNDELELGAYLFHPTLKSWHWFAKAANAPVYELWIRERPAGVPTGP
jgi:hypothetical protein